MNIAEVLKEVGFELSVEQLRVLELFHRLLMEWNRKTNLTRIRDEREMVLKHYVDSFMVLRLLGEIPSPLLDLGSGAGFPGVPLKIASPALEVILAEASLKKVRFLNEVTATLGLAGLEVVARFIDATFDRKVRGVITRAVEPIRDTFKRVRGCLEPGGKVIFMKGPRVDTEIKSLSKFTGAFIQEEDIHYKLPVLGHRRRLIVFRRAGVT